MINKSQNKQIKTEDGVQKQSFFFPDFGIAIEATSQEEALEKLEEIKKNNK